jgi:hypothetical protein
MCGVELMAASRHYRWYWYGSDGHAINDAPKQHCKINEPLSLDEVRRHYPRLEGKIPLCHCCENKS